jgi:hypothetical protein
MKIQPPPPPNLKNGVGLSTVGLAAMVNGYGQAPDGSMALSEVSKTIR